jgi:hypothetical protein
MAIHSRGLGDGADRCRLGRDHNPKIEDKRMTVHELLAQAGEGLYGKTWQSDLGRAIRVDRRTISRWANALQTPRPGVLIEVRELVRRRMAELTTVDKALTEWIER